VGLGFRGQTGRSLDAQHRLQSGHIVGKRIISAPSPTRESQDAVTIRTADRATDSAISQPPAVARYVVASASRCPPGGSQAGLG
jgi:hypothetical protein